MNPFSCADFEVEAQRLVTDARSKAQAILQQAMAEASNLKELARAAGLEEGRREAGAEVEKTAVLLNEIAGRMRLAQETLRLESERDLVRLAVAIAEKIVKAEIAAGRPVVEQNASRALDLLVHPREAVIRVNPAEVRRLDGLADRSGVRIEADATVEAGGVIVDTPKGTVDLSIRTQLDRIEKGLLS